MKKFTVICISVLMVLVVACKQQAAQVKKEKEVNPKVMTIKLMGLGASGGYIGIDEKDPECIDRAIKIIGEIQNEKIAKGESRLLPVVMMVGEKELRFDVKSLNNDKEIMVQLKADDGSTNTYKIDKDNPPGSSLFLLVGQVLQQNKLSMDQAIKAFEKDVVIK